MAGPVKITRDGRDMWLWTDPVSGQLVMTDAPPPAPGPWVPPDPPPWSAPVLQSLADGAVVVNPVSAFGLPGAIQDAGGAPLTDDALVINQAIVLAGGGGRVQLGPGLYTARTPIVPVTGVSIVGSGIKTQILWDNTIVPVLIQPAATAQHVSIRDLRLSQSNPATGGTCIDASLFQFARLERLLIDSTAAGADPNTGVQHNNGACHYNVLRDCVIFVDGANAIGVSYTGGANSNVLDNCRILPATADATQRGIYVNAYAIELSRPDIESIAGTAIQIDAGATSNRPTQLIAPYLENPAGTNIGIINGGCPPAMGSGRFTIAKPGNTPRASVTAVAADPDLSFTMIPGRVYAFRFLLFYDGAASAAADFKASLIAQGVPTFIQAAYEGLALASLTAPQGQATEQVTQAAGSLVSFPTCGVGAATAAVARIEGTVGPGNGGTFGLQWAQRLSNATATTLYQGSTLTVEQIS